MSSGLWTATGRLGRLIQGAELYCIHTRYKSARGPVGDFDLKRIPRDPVRFDVFRAFAAGPDVDFHDKEAMDGFKTAVAASLKRSLDDPKFLYGQHVQAMFEGVVIALGQVHMIKEEDAGGGWYDGDKLSIPDYRIVMRDRTQFLVEVKNHNGNHLEIALTKIYVDGLRRYGELTGAPVKLAVYWVRWRTWTLVPLDLLDPRPKHYVLPFVKAVAASELSLLGDKTIATRPPLVMKFLADRNKPRSLDDRGQAQMVIAGTELFCGGQEILDEPEREIAFMLMTGGRWEEMGPWAEFDADGGLNAIVFEFHPHEDHQQGFEMIGSLSEIFSSHFRWRTMQERGVLKLEVDVVPGQMANLIPEDYDSSVLPIWRFTLRPTHDVPLMKPMD